MSATTAMQESAPLERLLDAGFRQAIVAAVGAAGASIDPLIRPSQRAEFGDFQANGVMALARQLGRNPRELAAQIAAAADLGDLAEPLEVAGPGFINIRVRPAALGRLLAAMDAGGLGVRRNTARAPVVVDMCSVNVAKQMHVGHLRSSIIGDALARVLERTGRQVRRENHLGDWGLPIAMVLCHLRSSGADLDALRLEDLDAAYRQAQLAAQSDESAVEAARATLVALQQGEASLRRDWHKLIDCTMRALYEVLEMLNVQLGEENSRGESSYNDVLAEVVDAMVRAAVATEDGGALVVRFPDRERPMLIRKSDGGYLYATTDLAAVRERVHQVGADRVIYVVDARQRDHFRDVFEGAALMGWDRTPDGTAAQLVHIAFGSVLGPDRKPLKTRSGESVTLRSLLDEAIERGAREVMSRAAAPGSPTHGLPEEELRRIGRAVGIGAVKYADLSSDLARDYVFDMGRMISFEGDTGPYLQYAHARVCSILAKANVAPASLARAPIGIEEPAEKQLALRLLRYGPTVEDVAATLEPHRLCAYLYDLARTYSIFFEQCPVLRAPSPEQRASRLRLCDLVRRVMAEGLGVLGIEAPAKM